jgi:hypothetical protein
MTNEALRHSGKEDSTQYAYDQLSNIFFSTALGEVDRKVLFRLLTQKYLEQVTFRNPTETKEYIKLVDEVISEIVLTSSH